MKTNWSGCEQVLLADGWHTPVDGKMEADDEIWSKSLDDDEVGFTFQERIDGRLLTIEGPWRSVLAIRWDDGDDECDA